MITRELGQTLADCLSSLAFETARRVNEEIRDPNVQRIVRRQVAQVLVDYFLGQFKPRTYLLEENATAITCVRCGMTSYNAGDVEHFYCGNCKLFHER